MDSLCQKMKSPGQSVDLIHNIFPTTLDSTQQKKMEKEKVEMKALQFARKKKRIIFAVVHK